MRLILLALVCATTLSGCFWFGSGDLYAGYRQNFGTYVSNANVNTFCLTPQLRFVIWSFESHFGRKVVMNSGYRDPSHNADVGGQDGSFHMKCMAADFFMPGIDKRQLIAYAMRERAVGGLGCYPGRNFIHVDVRDRPRGWSHPVTFSGC
jgi:uncharacterized protein YcbK (DUF882 family)